jgi:hypothetical protein
MDDYLDMDDYENMDFNEREDWLSDEDVEYKAEAKAFERVGGGLLGTKVDKEKKHLQDPIEKFSVTVDAISRNLANYIDLNQKDIDNMIENIGLLKNIEFKNPSGYVLGYLASKGGKKIEKSIVQNIFKNALPHTQGITEPDIIRYAKLWLSL